MFHFQRGQTLHRSVRVTSYGTLKFRFRSDFYIELSPTFGIFMVNKRWNSFAAVNYNSLKSCLLCPSGTFLKDYDDFYIRGWHRAALMNNNRLFYRSASNVSTYEINDIEVKPSGRMVDHFIPLNYTDYVLYDEPINTEDAYRMHNALQFEHGPNGTQMFFIGDVCVKKDITGLLTVSRNEGQIIITSSFKTGETCLKLFTTTVNANPYELALCKEKQQIIANNEYFFLKNDRNKVIFSRTGNMHLV